MPFSIESLVRDGKVAKVGQRGIRGRSKADLRFWKVYDKKSVHISDTGDNFLMFTVDRKSNHNIRGIVAVKANTTGVYVGWTELKAGDEIVIKKKGEELLRVKNTGLV